MIWFIAGYFVGGFTCSAFILWMGVGAESRRAAARVRRMNELNRAKRLTGHVC